MEGLIDRQADLELRDAKDNTPLLLAAGVGVTDIVELLIARGAYINVVNHLGKSCRQKSGGSSTHCIRPFEQAGALQTRATASGQTRNGVSSQRQARYVLSGTDGLHYEGLRTNRATGSRRCSHGPGVDTFHGRGYKRKHDDR